MGRVHRTLIQCCRGALLCVCLAIFATTSQAQLTTPLHIYSAQPIVDEHGVKLRGSSYDHGDVIQVLWASNSIIYPPAVDGSPDPRNSLVTGGVTGIGSDTIPSLVDEGIFATSIAADRPGDGSQIFVRAFNAKVLQDACFYGDSQIFTVDGNTIFPALIGATSNALDTGDMDGDGLNNSWEESMGTRIDNPDTDRDGMSDGDEVRAGTDLFDSDSLLALSKTISFSGQDVVLSWTSVTGKQYEVQFAAPDLGLNPDFIDVSFVVLGTNDITSTVVTNGLMLGPGTFRIGLVED